MTFPGNYTRVWVRGRIIDLEKAAKDETEIGIAQPVVFTPSPKVLLDVGTGQIIASNRSFTVLPAATDGYFAVALPATDDPDINPTDWTYKVAEPTGRTYDIGVPIATPILNAPGDPLHNKPVIDLINVVPAPAPDSGTVQLLPVEVRTPAIEVADAATITVDASTNRVFKTVIQGNRTLGDPSGAYDGQTLILIVEQGSGGGFIPTLGPKYRLPAGKFLSWSSAAGRKDRLMLQYDGDDDKFDVLGFQPGYGA